ncbi:MAG: hypothetical protein ACO1OO_14060 [Flavisolibacter sp.]
MKKGIAIFFFAVYLLSTTQFSEVLKLPVLIEHFVEHRTDNSELSFLRFLSIHYLHGTPKDADFDRDMQLPFKDISESSFTAATYTAPAPIFINVKKPVYKPGEENLFAGTANYSYQYLSSIWQPPRV